MNRFNERALASGRQFRARRALLAPAVILGLLAAAYMLGANPGVMALIGIAFVGVGLISGLMAATWKASVVGDQLITAGTPPLGARTGGRVDLTKLKKVSSVGVQNGLVARSGPAMFRPFFLLEDASGEQAWLSAWGWEDWPSLQAVLRHGVERSQARMDPLTFWRLGLKPSTPGQISRWRRVL